MNVTRAAEQTTMRKVYLRLLPFSILCMFVCYLDRVNVGFAALTMNKDLEFSADLFGLGAGAFYTGYCLFEAPSNLVLEKDATGSFENGLYALAGFMLLAAVVTAIGVQAPRRRILPAGLAAPAAE
jgi:nitrate/nitrite transporter NarK